ncbi:MAG: NusG domain II-containing protein [Elusimicrobia bacterium]|nr:NusG domain II-containing protein [Elusimicrobiota bacterium]
MNKQKFYQVSKYDFIVAIAILVFSSGSLMSLKNINIADKEAIIYKNGKLIERINLSQKKVINIGKMEIEVRDGRIRILESDCPHQICKHSGWITSPAQTIVCVPNKILIEIAGSNKDTDTECNAVSY